MGYRHGQFFFTQTSKDSGVQVWAYGPDGQTFCTKGHDPKGFGKTFDYKWTTLTQNGPYHYYLENRKKEGMALSGLSSAPNCETATTQETLSKPGEIDFYGFYRTGVSPNGNFTIKYLDMITPKGGVLHYIILDSSGKVSTFDSYNFGHLKGVLTEAFVDNAGQPFLLLRNYRLKKDRQPGQAEQYSVWVKLQKGREAMVFPLDFPNLQIAGIDVLPAPGNGFFLAGFAYSFEGEPKHLIQRDVVTSSMDIRSNNKGLLASQLLVFEYNAEKMEVSKKIDTRIPPHLLFDILSNDADDLIPFAIRQVFPLEGNGFQLVCEQFQSLRMISGSGSNYYFKFNDVAIVEIGAGQDLKNLWRFAKRQSGGGEVSVLATRIHNRLHVLYADHQENLTLSPGVKPRAFSAKSEKSGLIITSFEDGRLTQRKILYPFQDGQPVPLVLLSAVVAPGEIMLLSKEKFGLLKLD